MLRHRTPGSRRSAYMTCLMCTWSAVRSRAQPERRSRLACLWERPISRCMTPTSRICRWGSKAYAGSIIDVLVFTSYYTNVVPTDVVINSPAGTNYNGVTISGGGSLNASTANLVIKKPGQSYGGTSGGVLISDDASMTATNGSLVITGSNGQGVMALNNSHATVIGATVTGGCHGGLVAANLSSIDVSAGHAQSR